MRMWKRILYIQLSENHYSVVRRFAAISRQKRRTYFRMQNRIETLNLCIMYRVSVCVNVNVLKVKWSTIRSHNYVQNVVYW